MDELADGETRRVAVQGEPVCLYRLGNSVYATHDLCTHGTASLAEGYIDGENIECPMHQGLFHIPTGKAVGAPCTIDVHVYPIKIESNDIYVGDNAQDGIAS